MTKARNTAADTTDPGSKTAGRSYVPFNRAKVVDEHFVRFLSVWDEAQPAPRPLSDPVRAGYPLQIGELLKLFESQMITRHLDLIARDLRSRDAGYYTIGSAGHEGNVVLGRLTRPTDPAFLHYRSGAFVIERARFHPECDVIYDVLLSQAASAEDPIAGGRHKVWGSRPLWILPQTSTIASHLPKAVGCAIAIQRAKRLRLPQPVPDDSIVICSFGDASINHSTALGAINAARWTSYQRLPVPILFVCEDNGIGVSVRTPPGWIETCFGSWKGLQFFDADGLDLVHAHGTAKQAVEYVRERRMPALLRLRTIRILGHAGSDFEPEYRSMEEIARVEGDDPLLHSAPMVLATGRTTAPEIIRQYESIRTRVAESAERALERPKLTTAAQVMAPLAPYSDPAVYAEAIRSDYQEARVAAFGGERRLPEASQPRHLAVQINQALYDLLAKYPEAMIFGEDVAQKGGVYHVTAGLRRAFGAGRVFNTLLDEQNILGLAQGMGFMDLLPIAEIQYLAYFHNACDQVRGEACSMQYFSNDQFRNPMIVRIASLAYQKGFGGHFHNDNSIAALRDIPGLIVACPSRGDDAAAMLRTAAAAAKIDGRVVAFLEPIALYMTKDLHEKGDGGWLFPFPPPGIAIRPGEGRVYDEEATDLAIITYGNGVHLSLQAARTLREEHGIRARILDLRWLNPLNHTWIAEQAAACDRVLVVDEGRRSGGVAEAIITGLVENGLGHMPIGRVTGADTYIPLGPAANLVLPSVVDIVAAGRT